MADMERDIERIRDHVGDILAWKADIRVALTEIKAEGAARDTAVDTMESNLDNQLTAINERLAEGNDIFVQYRADHVTLEALRKDLKLNEDDSVVDAMKGMQKTIGRVKKALWGGAAGLAGIGGGEEILEILKALIGS
tara:strand:- start:400 stop:813 length:414 start_codon:yes stop_codon:yes gene_type:complete